MRPLMLACLLLAASGLSAAVRSQPAFFSVSDVHFNPFYDPALVARLATTDASGWPAIFASSTITAPSAYGEDTNDPLLQSFLADMKTRAAGARFVTISGDLLGHDFEKLFQAYAPDKSAAAYQSFVTKTVQFIAVQFQLAMPGMPIYPVIGNNDSDCGDYNVTPGGWFLAAFAAAWAPSVRSSTFVQQFTHGGHYAVDGPAHNLTIIGINSTFFSRKFTNPCGQGGTDYGAEELAWLGTQLAAAKKDRRRVWLLYHIPPGIDVYSTMRSGASCPAPVSFWKTPYTTTFDALMGQYAPVITASLAGHTHMDDFLVLYEGMRAAPGEYIHITPSVSPIFDNNPAYERMTYSPAKATITDYTVYSLPLSSQSPAWSAEYAFRSAYRQRAYSAATLARVRSAIRSSAATRERYIRYYTVSNPAAGIITPQNWMGYWCGTAARTAAAFQECFCPKK